MTTRIPIALVGIALVILATTGCVFLDPAGWSRPKPEPARTATAEPVTSAPAFWLPGTGEATKPPIIWTAQTGTVGSVAYVQGARRMAVRGYGLLVGLDGPGSTRIPKNLSEYLQKEISRLQRHELGRMADVSPLDLIRSPHSVPVVVEGEIPPAAVKGARFDIFVRVIDRDVKSLAGGILLPCNLRIVANPETPMEGRVLAHGAGRVFTNPFARGTAAAGDSEPGRGRIMGGACSNEDRRIQLILTTPSYSMVQRISHLLNARFGAEPKIADAVSPTNIRLTVPKAHHGHETRFLDLVLHLSLTESTELAEARARALTDDLTRPDVPLDDTALCLEAMGRMTIPLVRRQYAHRQRATSFYAARVGARLGDELSVEALRRHAAERGGLYRQMAIQELGETKAHPTAVSMALRELLDDADPLVRLAAYEALRGRGDGCIERHAVGQDNFVLDVVQSGGPAIIYARRTGDRRIAVLGASLRCRQPLLYSYPERPVTISARANDSKITLIRKVGGGARVWDPIHVSFAVTDLIRSLGSDPTEGPEGQPEGLGVDYPVVIDVLSELCQDKSIAADFRLEQPSLTDLLGPAEPVVRPESDEL